MLSVVSGDCSMGSLGLNASISSNQDGSHKSKRSIPLREHIRLHITIVVLAGPNEVTIGFDHIGDHIIDKSVFIPDLKSIEILFVLFLIDFSENVLEQTIVLFEDGVLGAEVKRKLLHDCEFEAGMSKLND